MRRGGLLGHAGPGRLVRPKHRDSEPGEPDQAQALLNPDSSPLLGGQHADPIGIVKPVVPDLVAHPNPEQVPRPGSEQDPGVGGPPDGVDGPLPDQVVTRAEDRAGDHQASVRATVRQEGGDSDIDHEASDT